MAEDTRLAHVEGRVEELSRNWNRLDMVLAEMNRKLDQKADAAALEALGTRLDSKIDRFATQLDAKIDAVGNRLDEQIERLDDKMTIQFRWIVGSLLTATGLLIAAAGVFAALVR